MEARTINPELRLLGVVLFGVGAGASRVRDRARELVAADLGGAAPVLNVTIRHVEAAAADARERGQLAHEMEASASAGPKWWERRRGVKTGPVIAASATSLAADYEALAQEIVAALIGAETSADHPQTDEVPA